MPSIASRTAYVLLAAIEEDMRAIVQEFGSDRDPVELLSDELTTTIKSRRARDKLPPDVTTVTQVLPYIDFQDSYQLILRLRASVPKELSQSLRDLQSKVIRCVPVRNRVAHGRPLDIDDLPTVVDLSSELSKISAWNWLEVDHARQELRSDTSYIHRVSANLIVDPIHAVANNLPAPDFDETSLLGRRDERRRIMQSIRGSWPVVSILGDGGIGKTALALQVCYDIAEQPDCPFETIVWVSAKNSQLTSTEIVRIENAVEDSLGLFAAAAQAVGESTDSKDAVSKLLAVLETFPTLLVLDNVETILDENFGTLLQDIPVRSKILITSRIGVKTESPFKLGGLSLDDAKHLLRSLARARNIDLNAVGSDEDIAQWATKMSMHPAYLKWFVAGIQSGQSPEKLLSDNGLVLDFCMSNVFDFLGEGARTVLEAMLVVPGSHTLAELAFLTSFDALRVRAAILDLTSTNFVSYVRGGASGAAIQLSDFAREYLRRSLNVATETRREIMERQVQLYSEGGGLQQEHAKDPYSVSTIDIRGAGDYSAARLLRQALETAGGDAVDDGLRLCAEAADLAPGYHEAARVQGYLHEKAANFGEAYESYSLARDLAPENPYVAYFLGKFQLSSGFDPRRGLLELQRAAKLDPTSSFLQLEISEAHITSGSFRLAMEAAAFTLGESRQPTTDDEWFGAYWLFYACVLQLETVKSANDWATFTEDLEFAVSSSRSISIASWSPQALDMVLLIQELSRTVRGEMTDVS